MGQPAHLKRRKGLLLESINGWHWLAIACILLLLQLKKAARALVGLAVGATLVALISSFVPLPWSVQWPLFALFGLLSTAVYWRWFQFRLPANATEKLGKRKARLLGMRASLMGQVKGGRGSLQMCDALWSVTCSQDLPAGTVVEVTGYDDSALHVSKV